MRKFKKGAAFVALLAFLISTILPVHGFAADSVEKTTDALTKRVWYGAKPGNTTNTANPLASLVAAGESTSDLAKAILIPFVQAAPVTYTLGTVATKDGYDPRTGKSNGLLHAENNPDKQEWSWGVSKAANSGGYFAAVRTMRDAAYGDVTELGNDIQFVSNGGALKTDEVLALYNDENYTPLSRETLGKSMKHGNYANDSDDAVDKLSPNAKAWSDLYLDPDITRDWTKATYYVTACSASTDEEPNTRIGRRQWALGKGPWIYYSYSEDAQSKTPVNYYGLKIFQVEAELLDAPTPQIVGESSTAPAGLALLGSSAQVPIGSQIILSAKLPTPGKGATLSPDLKLQWRDGQKVITEASADVIVDESGSVTAPQVVYTVTENVNLTCELVYKETQKPVSGNSTPIEIKVANSSAQKGEGMRTYILDSDTPQPTASQGPNCVPFAPIWLSDSKPTASPAGDYAQQTKYQDVKGILHAEFNAAEAPASSDIEWKWSETSPEAAGGFSSWWKNGKDLNGRETGRYSQEIAQYAGWKASVPGGWTDKEAAQWQKTWETWAQGQTKVPDGGLADAGGKVFSLSGVARPTEAYAWQWPMSAAWSNVRLTTENTAGWAEAAEAAGSNNIIYVVAASKSKGGQYIAYVPYTVNLKTASAKLGWETAPPDLLAAKSTDATCSVKWDLSAPKDCAYTWSSSDENVLTVEPDKDHVTAKLVPKKQGNATITVTATWGEIAPSVLKVEKEVKVEDPALFEAAMDLENTTEKGSVSFVEENAPKEGVAFAVKVTSSATPPEGVTYQWQSQTGGSKTWTPLTGETKAALSFTQEQLNVMSVSTKYQCVVKAPSGGIYNPAQVTVPGFSITVTPKPAQLSEQKAETIPGLLPVFPANGMVMTASSPGITADGTPDVERSTGAPDIFDFKYAPGTDAASATCTVTLKAEAEAPTTAGNWTYMVSVPGKESTPGVTGEFTLNVSDGLLLTSADVVLKPGAVAADSFLVTLSASEAKETASGKVSISYANAAGDGAKAPDDRALKATFTQGTENERAKVAVSWDSEQTLGAGGPWTYRATVKDDNGKIIAAGNFVLTVSEGVNLGSQSRDLPSGSKVSAGDPVVTLSAESLGVTPAASVVEITPAGNAAGETKNPFDANTFKGTYTAGTASTRAQVAVTWKAAKTLDTPGSWSFDVTVVDSNENVIAEGTFKLEVRAAERSVQLSSNTQVSVGAPITVTASLTGFTNPVVTWRAVGGGDPLPTTHESPTPTQATATFTPTAAGSLVVTATVRDTDDVEFTASRTITVTSGSGQTQSPTSPTGAPPYTENPTQSPTGAPPYTENPTQTPVPWIPPVTVPGGSAQPSAGPSASADPSARPSASAQPSAGSSASPSSRPTGFQPIAPAPGAPAPVEITTAPGVPGNVLKGLPISTRNNEHAAAMISTYIDVPAGATIEMYTANEQLIDVDNFAVPFATGQIVRVVSSNGNILDEATVVVMGDVLGTGELNIAQLVRIAQSCAGEDALGSVYLLAGDFQDNNRIDIGDVVREARMLAGNRE